MLPLALLWLAACGEEGAAPLVEAAKEAPPGTTLEGPLLLSEAVHGPMPVPPRYAAELPYAFDELLAGEGPPIGYVHGQICRGDATMRSAWEERYAAAWATGIDGWTLYTTWGSVAQCGNDADTCAWLRERFVKSQAPFLHESDGYLLAQCDDEATRALIEPDYLGPVVHWYRSRSVQGAPWSPRLEETLRISVRSGDVAFAREVAGILANLDPARTDGIVLALRSQAGFEMADALTVGLWRSADPKARELVEELCGSARSVDPATGQNRWPECEWRHSYAPIPVADVSDMASWVRLWSSDPLERATQHPEEAEALAEALSTCVSDELGRAAVTPETAAPWTVYGCLRSLAALDRRAAAALAPTVQGANLQHAGLSYLAASLLRFPRADDVERRAREIGLTQGSAARSDAPIRTAEDVLLREGHLYNVYEGGWAWPVGYDELLADLAAMAPPLASARFASREPVWKEVPEPVFVEPEPEPLADLFSAFAEPEEAPRAEDPPKYVVHAYFGGERWRVEARDQGDWPDLDATLGLLNRLLEADGSNLRFAETAQGEVVVAPGEALIAADREGMLDLVDPAARYADELAVQAAQASGEYYD